MSKPSPLFLNTPPSNYFGHPATQARDSSLLPCFNSIAATASFEQDIQSPPHETTKLSREPLILCFPQSLHLYAQAQPCFPDHATIPAPKLLPVASLHHRSSLTCALHFCHRFPPWCPAQTTTQPVPLFFLIEIPRNKVDQVW
ncbi:hypothetical protein M0R45_021917 [Rubus argutus]|uniref:Uncharacterized protein n=1 Tax=Rubus argutus TaxID=59490 RepID=A0AAW1XGA9_RUBAR